MHQVENQQVLQPKLQNRLFVHAFQNHTYEYFPYQSSEVHVVNIVKRSC